MYTILFRKTCWILVCVLFLSSCGLHQKQASGSYSLTNTKWVYIDNDWTYDVYFKKGGKLLTTHPNDHTKGNDSWEQNSTVIKFYYNDKFSSYSGTLIGKDTIIGTAQNQTKTWEFKLIKK
jgi:hypothetical protein